VSTRAPARSAPAEAAAAPARPRRALHVATLSLAIPRQMLPIARALVRDGWEVDIACGRGPHVAELEGTGVGYIPVEFSRKMGSARHLATLARLVGVLRRGRYDVVHLHGPIPSLLGRLAARATGTPVLHHARGTFFTDGLGGRADPLLLWLYPRLERMLAPSTGWTLTLGAEDARYMVERGRHPAERVTCLGVGGCGLDLQAWNPGRFDAAARERRRQELGVPPGARVVGFVGRMVAEKGILELVEAFREVRAAGRDAHLVVVGGVDPSERDKETAREVHERVARYGLEGAVTFAGLVDAPQSTVAAFDVLALPSYREALGQVLLEAGAMGIPVVAASNAGTRAAVIDGGTGLLVPPRDAGALAAALLRLLDDPELAARMGATAAARAQEHSRERFMRTVLEVYDRLAPPDASARH